MFCIAILEGRVSEREEMRRRDEESSSMICGRRARREGRVGDSERRREKRERRMQHERDGERKSKNVFKRMIRKGRYLDVRNSIRGGGQTVC